MLLSDLKKTTNNMKQLANLQTASLDNKKKKENDGNYTKLVSDFYESMLKVKKANEVLDYSVSNDSLALIVEELNKIESVIESGVVDEVALYNARNGLYKKVNSSLSKDWDDFYSIETKTATNNLNAVGHLAYNEEWVKKTKENITNGKDWASLDEEKIAGNSRIDLFAKGIKDSNQLVEKLNLSDEIMDFIRGVISGTARIVDVNPNIIDWIHKEKLEDKFIVGFNTK